MENKIKDIWIDLSAELYEFILKSIKNEETAKDIHQDVFLKIQAKIDQLQNLSKLTPWVYQITRNTIVDHYRNNNSISIDDFEFAETAKENFSYSKLSRCVNKKIEQLSSRHKEVIMLTYFKDISQKELAQYLKISYSGTKSRVQKARKILKEKIIECRNIEIDTTGKLIDFEKTEM